MSHFLFLTRSGHDHRNLPYEVLGGIVLKEERIWAFSDAAREKEESAFGDRLLNHHTYIKGHRLLDKDRYLWANQGEPLDNATRRKHALSFLHKGMSGKAPTRIEFTAYGQACLRLANGLFQLMRSHDAKIIAAIIPRGQRKPHGFRYGERMRRDRVLLLERFFHLLEQAKSPGFLVLDKRENAAETRFIRRMVRYFTETRSGRFRSEWIVPLPLFAPFEENYPLQAADLCVYCINHGFRLPRIGMDAPVTAEVARDFGPVISNLQYYGDLVRGGDTFKTKGIVFVPDPYGQEHRSRSY